MTKEQISTLTEELVVKIITANPHLAHPIVRAIASYFIRITVRYIFSEAELFLRFTTIDSDSTREMKELQIARHRLRIAIIQGSTQEIEDAEKDFKIKFNSFIRFNK